MTLNQAGCYPGHLIRSRAVINEACPVQTLTQLLNSITTTVPNFSPMARVLAVSCFSHEMFLFKSEAFAFICCSISVRTVTLGSQSMQPDLHWPCTSLLPGSQSRLLLADEFPACSYEITRILMRPICQSIPVMAAGNGL